jgi:hypothetical protein
MDHFPSFKVWLGRLSPGVPEPEACASRKGRADYDLL